MSSSSDDMKKINAIWSQYNKAIGSITTYLNKKAKNLTSQEFLFLDYIYKNPKKNTKEISKETGQAYLFTMFNLNALERKQILILKSKSIKNMEIDIEITELGIKIVQDFYKT